MTLPERSNSGFSLVQISILLTIAALVMVAVMPSSQNNLAANSASKAKMTAVLTAMRTFEASNGYLPCPADPEYGINYTTNAYYGVQVAGSGTTNDCHTGTHPEADFSDHTNHVAIGMVPVRTLGLANSYALDGFGRDITYAVDTNATTCWTSSSQAGAITVADNGSYNSTVAALISHGLDGHGAYLPNTGSGTALMRMNAGSTDTDQLVNAHITTGTFPTAAASSLLPWSGSGANATFVKKPPTSTFDDLVVYNSPLWNLNVMPSVMRSAAPTITYSPANGTYNAPQAITITATFPQSVTVSTSGGTPYITLGALGYTGTSSAIFLNSQATNIAQANYTGGSGTTALTFTYAGTVNDNAPNGIYMASNITLNGGTISGCPLFFTAPSLSGVIISSLSLWVTDSANGRVEGFSSGGSYVTSFGTLGTGSGNFEQPTAIAIDSSGNLWITDGYNNRVEEFSAAGSYITSFGSGGSGNGKFANPFGIAIDSSGNFWVADFSNNRLQKWNSSLVYQSSITGISNAGGVAVSGSTVWVSSYAGGYLEHCPVGGGSCTTVGSAGTSDSKFSSPLGITFDTGGNYYVADQGNSRVLKFNSSGTWQMTIGGGSGCAGAYVSSTSCSNVNGYASCCKPNSSTCSCSSGTTNGLFYNPTNVAVDSSGNIWVTDLGNSRVQEFNSSGSFSQAFGSAGTGNGKFGVSAAGYAYFGNLNSSGGTAYGPYGIAVIPSR